MHWQGIFIRRKKLTKKENEKRFGCKPMSAANVWESQTDLQIEASQTNKNTAQFVVIIMFLARSITPMNYLSLRACEQSEQKGE
ncbi:MAG: hypothetical protein QM523_05025 [Candidatus Pacebacteria bacterium]|nr:hypothetical protein [Candidatus Paceibacterota bacterium]